MAYRIQKPLSSASRLSHESVRMAYRIQKPLSSASRLSHTTSSTRCSPDLCASTRASMSMSLAFTSSIFSSMEGPPKPFPLEPEAAALAVTRREDGTTTQQSRLAARNLADPRSLEQDRPLFGHGPRP